MYVGIYVSIEDFYYVIHETAHSFSKYLLSASYMPGVLFSWGNMRLVLTVQWVTLERGTSKGRKQTSHFTVLVEILYCYKPYLSNIFMGQEVFLWL